MGQGISHLGAHAKSLWKKTESRQHFDITIGLFHLVIGCASHAEHACPLHIPYEHVQSVMVSAKAAKCLSPKHLDRDEDMEPPTLWAIPGPPLLFVHGLHDMRRTSRQTRQADMRSET